MFPAAEPLVNDADYLCQALLIQALAPPCFQHKIRSGLHASRVVAKKSKDARPLRHDRLSFVALPALINLS